MYSILNADDELGLDARRAIIGGYYMEDQLNQIQQYIYSPVPGRGPRNYLEEELRRARLEGLGLIKQIREILSSADDPEAEAMAIVYEADFQLLLDRGSAARSYREAMDQLAAAGVNEDRIAEFFSRPSALPEPEFHTRLEVALSAQDQRGYDVSSAPDRINLGTFVAWNESLASAQRPALPTAALAVADEVPMAEFDIQFRLNSRGEARNRKILDANTDNSRLRSDARDALELIRFRPQFDGDRRIATDELQITYRIPNAP